MELETEQPSTKYDDGSSLKCRSKEPERSVVERSLIFMRHCLGIEGGD